MVYGPRFLGLNALGYIRMGRIEQVAGWDDRKVGSLNLVLDVLGFSCQVSVGICLEGI